MTAISNQAHLDALARAGTPRRAAVKSTVIIRDPFAKPFVRAALAAGRAVPNWVAASSDTADEFEAKMAVPFVTVFDASNAWRLPR
jgi:O-methyltransferase involved in polyketide biosynthesis